MWHETFIIVSQLAFIFATYIISTFVDFWQLDGIFLFFFLQEFQPSTNFGETNTEICVFKDFLDHHQALFEVRLFYIVFFQAAEFFFFITVHGR